MNAPRGPLFFDEDGQAGPPPAGLIDAAGAGQADALVSVDASEAATGTAASLPRGPLFLEPEEAAPARVDVGWAPEAVAVPVVRVGAGFWVAAGLCLLVVSWLVLSVASFVLALLAQSAGLGVLASVAIGVACAMLLYGSLLEVRAYRSLGTVERLRAVLAAPGTTVEVAREQALTWLQHVSAGIPDRHAVERMLRGAATVAEVRSVLRSQVADRLREAAMTLGRRAAVEGATLVAICPHPAWEGAIAGGRGLLLIRRVAALYGLRPGLAVTLALLRRVIWTAAGTAGLSLVSQGLADHVLSNAPVLKHVTGALPETGVVAVRLYRLAGVTAEACSPVA